MVAWGATKGPIAYSTANILPAVGSLGMIPVLLAELGTEGYGLLGHYFLACSILPAAIGGALSAWAGRHHVAEQQDEAGKLLPYILSGLLCAVYALAAALALTLANFLIWDALALSVTEYSMWNWGIICTYLSTLVTLALVYLQMEQRPLVYVSIVAFRVLLDVLITLFLIEAASPLTARPIGAAISSIVVITLLVIGYSVKNPEFSPLSLRKSSFLYLVRDGLHWTKASIGHSLSAAFSSTSDRWIIVSLGSVADFGLYTVCMQLANGFRLLCDGVNRALIPPLYGLLLENSSTADAKLRRVIKVFFIALPLAAAVYCSLIFIVIGSDLITVPPLANTVVFWLVAAQLGHGFYLLNANYYFFYRRMSLLSTISTGAMVLSLLGTGLGFFSYGLAGAAVGIFVVAMLKAKIISALRPASA